MYREKWIKYSVFAGCVAVILAATYFLIVNTLSPETQPMNTISDDNDRIANAIRSSRAVSDYNLSLDSINSYDDHGDGWYIANVTFSDSNNTGKILYNIILRKISDGTYSIVIDIDDNQTDEIMIQKGIPESIRKKINQYRISNEKNDHE